MRSLLSRVAKLGPRIKNTKLPSYGHKSQLTVVTMLLSTAMHSPAVRRDQLATVSSACSTGRIPERPSAYIIDGLWHGFRVGFNHSCQLHSSHRNMQSALQQPTVVDEHVQGEKQGGRIVVPFPPSVVPGLHVNRMGIIPKGHTPGRWRLITDLSFPEGRSINDGIPAALCSLW